MNAKFVTSFVTSLDHVAVSTGNWWFEEIGDFTLPVREAQKTDRIVWTVNGKKVATIHIPTPDDVGLSCSRHNIENPNPSGLWALWLYNKHPNWVKIALQLYTDKWTFQDNNPVYKRYIEELEVITNMWSER